MSEIVDLESSVEVDFLAEGAANVVYRLVLPPPSPNSSADIDFESESLGTSTPPPSEIPILRYDPRLENKLLRMRKDTASAVPVMKSQRQFEDVIRPLVPREYVVEQILVRLPEGLARHCNAQLREMEKLGSRKPERYGSYLNIDEQYAILVTDMSASQGSELVSFEFKPKWLVQSVSAPKGSRKCRTCALRNMRNKKQMCKGRAPEDFIFCPLDLISEDKSRVEHAVDGILRVSDLSAAVAESTRSVIVNFLCGNQLLRRLKELQIRLDRRGSLHELTIEQDFLTAMTLRDCTLFMRVSLLILHIRWLTNLTFSYLDLVWGALKRGLVILISNLPT